MNMPAKFLRAAAPAALTSSPVPDQAQPMRHPATVNFLDHYAELEEQVRNLKERLGQNAIEIATQVGRIELLTNDRDRLQVDSRELQAAVNSFKVSNAVIATTAVAEVERHRDRCVQAVKEIADASKLLIEGTASRIKDLHDASAETIRRVFDKATEAIDQANEHALRAGVDRDVDTIEIKPCTIQDFGTSS